MKQDSGLIDRLLASGRSGYRPDMDSWQPERRVQSHMHITTDGRWFHKGSEIKRARMVSLFATLLRREGDEHFLVTPVEKALIEIEDTPFLIVDFESDGRGQGARLVVQTNLGEWVAVNACGQLFMQPLAGGSQSCPCVDVRNGLIGRFSRAAHYRLAELMVERNHWLGIWSYQHFHALEKYG